MTNAEKVQFAHLLLLEVERDLEVKERAIPSHRLTLQDKAYFQGSYKAIQKAHTAFNDLTHILKEGE